MSELDTSPVPEPPRWRLDELLDVEAEELDEHAALVLLKALQQTRAMLDSAYYDAVERLATLRADDEWTQDFLAAELKVTMARAGDDLALAHTLATRTPRTRGALAAGELDLPRVRQIERAVTPLTDEQVLDVEQRIYPWVLDKNPRQIYYLLRKVILEVDPEGAAARAEARRQDRRVTLDHEEEGMSWLNTLLASEDAIAIYGLVDSLARQVAKDGRTMDQVRADVLRDLVLGKFRGRVETRVYVTANATTILGLDDLPGHLRGYGPIPAERIRELAFGLQATWQGVEVDESGKHCRLAEDTYRFTGSLAELIRLRDETCQFPACSKPAEKCDIDHHTPHDREGPTCPCNGKCYCRRHHRLKQSGLWTVINDNGDVTWISPAGNAHTN